MPDVKAAPPGAANPFEQLTKQLEEIARKQIPESEVQRLDAAIAGIRAVVDDMKKSLVDRSLTLPGAEAPKERFDFGRAASALHKARGNPKALKEFAPHEFEISEATRANMRKTLSELARIGVPDAERATLSTIVDSEGGFLVPKESLGNFYDVFWKTLVLDQLGVTKLTPNAALAEIVKGTGAVQAYDVFEGSVSGLAESNPTFGMLQLKQHELAIIASASKRALEFSDPSLSSILEAQMARRAAQHMENRVLAGSGAQGQCRGLLKAAGSTSATNAHLEGALEQVTDVNLANGSNTITPGIVVDFEGTLEDADVPLGEWVKILSHPKALRKYRKDTTNQYTLPSPLSRAKVREITGYDWVTSTQLPTTLAKSAYTATGSLTPFVMGDFRDFLVATWGGLVLKSSDIAYNPITAKSAFFGRLVHFMGTMLYDCGVIRSESIAASNELQVT